MLILINTLIILYLAPTAPPYYYLALCAAGCLTEMVALINEFIKRS